MRMAFSRGRAFWYSSRAPRMATSTSPPAVTLSFAAASLSRLATLVRNAAMLAAIRRPLEHYGEESPGSRNRAQVRGPDPKWPVVDDAAPIGRRLEGDPVGAADAALLDRHGRHGGGRGQDQRGDHRLRAIDGACRRELNRGTDHGLRRGRSPA